MSPHRAALCRLLCLLGWCSVAFFRSRASGCLVTMETHRSPSSFTFGNRLTILHHRRITLRPPPNATECHVDPALLFLSRDLHGALNAAFVHYEFLAISRGFPVTLRIRGDNSGNTTAKTGTPLAEVTFTRCVPSASSFRMLSSRTRLVEVTINAAPLPMAENPREATLLCDSWKTVAMLTVKDTRSFSLQPLLNCSMPFPLMSTVVVESSGLSEIPEDLQTIFPNLQSFDLRGNEFSIPPIFVVNSSRVRLPENVSRSSPVHEEYTDGGTIQISSREVRKAFLLDDNNITDLTQFEFHGCFDYVSIRNNQLEEVSNKTFSSLPCLRWLNLGDNKLTHLPQGLFSGLSQLRNLILSNNLLTSLRNSVFESLVELTELNLAKNRITFIEPGFFSSLQSLEILHFDDNNIVTIPDEIFHLNNIRELSFNNNPLQTFPDGVFHLEDLTSFSARNSSISSLNFTEKCRLDWPDLNMGVISSRTMKAMDIPMRPIDLRGAAPIQAPFVVEDKLCRLIMEVVFCSYRFQMDTLHCGCEVLGTASFLRTMLANSTCANVRQNAWSCASPEELRGRSLLSLLPEETYCPVQLAACPGACQCFRRAGGARRVIVDCRARGLTALPERLPEGVELELWLEDNALSALAPRPYLARLHALRLARNALARLEAPLLAQLDALRQLDLEANLLAALPRELARFSRQLQRLRLSSNPLRCDCHARWLQTWVASRPPALEDGEAITCNLAGRDGAGVLLTHVPADELVCLEDAVRARVALQAAVPSALLLLLAVGLGTAALFRRQLKLWLYVHTSWHPFDRDPPTRGPGQGQQEEGWDVAVVCGLGEDAWVWSQVSARLEQEQGLRVLHCWRDFRLGLTHGQNLARAAARCRRLLLVLTPESLGERLVGAAVRVGLEAARHHRANFLVLLLHGCRTLQTADPRLRGYLKAGRFLASADPHFFKKLMYYMPQRDKKDRRLVVGVHVEDGGLPRKNPAPDPDLLANIDRGKENAALRLEEVAVEAEGGEGNVGIPLRVLEMQPAAEDADPKTLPVFVWYHAADFAFVLEHLARPLGAAGCPCLLEDKDFLPGVSKNQNILQAIEASRCTVLVLSASGLRDEWLPYAYQAAMDLQVSSRGHGLALCLRQDCPEGEVGQELETVVFNGITLREGDTWFREHLLQLCKPLEVW